jgi:hypothetical protein
MPSGFIPVERPPGSVDIEEVARAEYALEQALIYSKFEPLIERLRSAASLLPEERALAADIIAGDRKRPKHRPAEDPRVLQNRQIYWAICVSKLVVDGVPLKRAVHQVAIEEKQKESAVQKAVQANKSAVFGGILRNRRSGKKVRT